jgi:hypothetical protein
MYYYRIIPVRHDVIQNLITIARGGKEGDHEETYVQRCDSSVMVESPVDNDIDKVEDNLSLVPA